MLCYGIVADVNLRLGTDAEFARLRCVLESAGLAALFEDEQAAAEVPEAGLLSALGLIGCSEDGWRARVSIHRVEDLWIAADLSTLSPKPADVVYPATEQTAIYLAGLPQLPCERFLDLGAGTGVAALSAASRYARNSWACDITPRAAHFAEFNRRLNGINNLTVGCGDLYDPVASLRFDRIGCHPPCVPVAEPTHIFRDGGEDGEQILRRIVEGLPDHLDPGGRFYALGMGSDREGESFEQRLRRWLGAHANDFDILLVADVIRTPESLRSPRGDQEREHWSQVFQKYRVKHLFFGIILLERHAESRRAYAHRTLASARSTWRETEWLRGLMASAAHDREWLLDGAPLMSPHLEVRTTQRVRGGRLAADECAMRVEYPFEIECRCRPWMVDLVSACDGNRTGRDHLAACSGISESGFAEVLRSLAAGGFIHYREFPMPL